MRRRNANLGSPPSPPPTIHHEETIDLSQNRACSYKSKGKQARLCHRERLWTTMTPTVTLLSTHMSAYSFLSVFIDGLGCYSPEPEVQPSVSYCKRTAFSFHRKTALPFCLTEGNENVSQDDRFSTLMPLTSRCRHDYPDCSSVNYRTNGHLTGRYYICSYWFDLDAVVRRLYS